jgi:hypothetical protein
MCSKRSSKTPRPGVRVLQLVHSTCENKVTVPPAAICPLLPEILKVAERDAPLPGALGPEVQADVPAV